VRAHFSLAGPGPSPRSSPPPPRRQHPRRTPPRPQEPFGLTLIEAAAHGVPIVATTHGGPVDIVHTLRWGGGRGLKLVSAFAPAQPTRTWPWPTPFSAGLPCSSRPRPRPRPRCTPRTPRNGLLVDPTDPKAIGDTLLRLLTDAGLWESCATAGRDNINAYSWPSHCVKYLCAIEKKKVGGPRGSGEQ
jgi:sucrose-phosphate synthase